MKNTLWIAAILAFITHGPSARAEGGEHSAGGADDYRILPAFFLTDDASPAPVKACLMVAPQFGIATAQLQTTVQDAFVQWSDYLKLKKLTDVLPSSQRIRDTVIFQDCDGSEELRVYFGIVNDEVSQYRAEFTHPFGFAALTSAEDAPARGIVWIAPPSSIPAPNGSLIPVWSAKTEPALAGLVLHEIGHVFGNGHVDDTVMTGDIGRYLETDTQLESAAALVDFYSKIDSRRDLVLCLDDCDESYSAAAQFVDGIHYPDSDWAYSFKTLVGRDAVGPIAIRFDRVAHPQPYAYPGSGTLVLTDAQGTYSLAVQVQTRIGGNDDSAHLFEGLGGKFFISSSVSFYGTVTTTGGASMPVGVSYNMDHVKVEITPMGQGYYVRPLFVSEN